MSNYSLSIDERPGYLHAKVTGTSDQENVFGYMQQVCDTCAARNRTVLLIEENLAGPGLSQDALFKLVSNRAPEARELLTRIAFVDVNPEHDFSRSKLMETYAVNRGVNLRVFSTPEAARDWLEKQD
jgi:hypothetical protein